MHGIESKEFREQIPGQIMHDHDRSYPGRDTKRAIKTRRKNQVKLMEGLRNLPEDPSGYSHWMARQVNDHLLKLISEGYGMATMIDQDISVLRGLSFHGQKDLM